MTALGKYVPRDTPMHRLDPRIKILGFIVFIVAIFLNYGPVRQNFLIYGIVFVLLLTMMIVGRVSFLQVFRSLKAIWLMMILLLVINVVITREGEIAFYLGNYAVYWEGIVRWSYIFLRLLLMIMMTSVLTSTTKPLEMTYALEWLMAPLNLVKIPVHMIAMTLSLALRFIPTLSEEAEKIMRAQASRGVDFKEGKLKDKFRAVISLIIPLFVSSLMRSGELADALEARGYDPLAKRTRYRRRHWDLFDTVELILLLAFLASMIVLAVYRPDFIGMMIGE